MFKKYGLNRLSLQLMELLWMIEKPLSYDEIFVLAKSRWREKRKIRKLESYLYDLQKAGAIIKNENTTICTYCAACSKGEFIDNWKQGNCRRTF